MKKILLIITFVCVLIAGAFVFYKKTANSPETYFKDLEETLESYEISGTLELVDDDALKTINIQSLYKKVDGVDYYYVRLEDSNTHQVQTIVKNKEGVFVLAQGFNRVFQFKSEWPNNGFKPYILNNMISLFDSKYELDKIRDGYVFKTNIQDIAHPKATAVMILFDQNLNITQVNLMDEDQNEVIQFEVTTYIINPNIDDAIFTINSQEEVAVANYETSILYPTNVYENELIDQFKSSQGHVMRYKGNDYFTIVQKEMKKKEVLSTELYDSEFYVFENGLLYFNQNSAILIHNGIETTLYSNSLTSDEMVNILLSLENNVVIEQ